jgi:hypothetical protein
VNGQAVTETLLLGGDLGEYRALSSARHAWQTWFGPMSRTGTQETSGLVEKLAVERGSTTTPRPAAMCASFSSAVRNSGVRRSGGSPRDAGPRHSGTASGYLRQPLVGEVGQVDALLRGEPVKAARTATFGSVHSGRSRPALVHRQPQVADVDPAVADMDDVAHAYLYGLSVPWATGTVLTVDGGSVLVAATGADPGRLRRIRPDRGRARQG